MYEIDCFSFGLKQGRNPTSNLICENVQIDCHNYLFALPLQYFSFRNLIIFLTFQPIQEIGFYAVDIMDLSGHV